MSIIVFLLIYIQPRRNSHFALIIMMASSKRRTALVKKKYLKEIISTDTLPLFSCVVVIVFARIKLKVFCLVSFRNLRLHP